MPWRGMGIWIQFRFASDASLYVIYYHSMMASPHPNGGGTTSLKLTTPYGGFTRKREREGTLPSYSASRCRYIASMACIARTSPQRTSGRAVSVGLGGAGDVRGRYRRELD